MSLMRIIGKRGRVGQHDVIPGWVALGPRGGGKERIMSVWSGGGGVGQHMMRIRAGVFVHTYGKVSVYRNTATKTQTLK